MVVRLTADTADWIRTLALAAEGSPNVSIGILRIPQGELNPLSIQILDHTLVFIDHLATRSPGEPRDLELHSATLAPVFDDHYMRLWDTVPKLVSHGVVDRSTLDAL